MNLIFFASGFAGLIYESIWTHYLKLFLGHAAYAQTLVLGIFMGGMAIGAALAAGRTARLARPLRLYAGVEALIGLLAIGFHPVFTHALDAFYALALAGGVSGAALPALKWGLAALLILPQSILLGATFPLFAAAATRRVDAASPGRAIATLYFANSIGGALGILLSGFVLIPALGLPGTITVAGLLNFLIAIAALKRAAGADERPGAPVATPDGCFGRLGYLLVAVAFLTGASSFIYEIGWIRMLSLVLGSATHSFELMLCAFISGLALGGLWVRKRVDSAANPAVLLGYVQLAMGCAAVATIALHSASFDLIGWVVRNTPKTDAGYAILNLVRYGVAALIMFPAAFCAGMTLPLATRVLHREQGQGERAIGVIYSANTVGAIAGLAFAVHIGLPAFGLEYLVAAGAMIDVLLGVALLALFAGRRQLRQALAATFACAAGAVAGAATFNPQKIVSGPIRDGQVGIEGAVIGLAHGRTATVSVERSGGVVGIRTNGKVDAAANLGAPARYQVDEVTMALIGAIPLALHERPERVANIGFGSGLTGAAILDDARVARLDTIEIEPKMVELARHFAPANDAVYDDPRSAIHIDDAKAFFAANGQSYDLIVSEPSNPWVSGVSGLFSVEFYRLVSRYLREGGMLAQWIQTYETHPERVASILKALENSFDDYMVIVLNKGDMLVVAKPHGRIALPADGYARLSRRLRERLRGLDVGGQADLSYRVVGDKALFAPWLAKLAAPANSDFAPYLDSHADYDRFIGKGWADIYSLAGSPYPIAEILARRPPLEANSALSLNTHFGNEPMAGVARLVHEHVLGAGAAPPPLSPQVTAKAREYFLPRAAALVSDCKNPPLNDAPYAAAAIAIKVLPYLSAREGAAVLAVMADMPCLRQLGGAQAQWLPLLKQVAARDARGFGASAEQLLDGGQGNTEARSKYLLTIGMLGHLGGGDPARARLLWNKFAARILGNGSVGLPLELLRDRAFGAEAPERPARRPL